MTVPVLGPEARQLIHDFVEKADGIDSPGDAPRMEDPIAIEIGENTAEELEKAGIHLKNGFGRENTIVFNRGQTDLNLDLSIGHATGTTIFIGKSAATEASVRIDGHNNNVCFSGFGGQYHNIVQVVVTGNRNIVHIGSDCTLAHVDFIFMGDYGKFLVGPDCMFSWGIIIRNYDQHLLFDTLTGQPINVPTHLRIGRHVWIGQDVLFNRGVEVGEGSVIASRSLVTRNIPANVIAGGSPAKIIRENASWRRELFDGNQKVMTHPD